MVSSRRSFERILKDKSREITDFSVGVEEIIDQAVKDVRKQFLRELDNVLADDLNNFHKKLVAAFARSGIELLVPQLGSVFGTIGGKTLGTSLGRIASNADIDIGGSALGGIVATQNVGDGEGKKWWQKLWD